MSKAQALLVIFVVAAVTLATRALPFALFAGKKQPPPDFIRYLGSNLPYAVMAVLVVYCLKGVQFDSWAGFLPELIAVVVVAALHVWKRNNLLSIGVGTALYMVLVQFVFVK